MSRRKTKTERELVADISDVFRKFCNKHSCIDCPYRFRGDCKLEYIKDLLDIYQENNEEE